MKKDEDIYILGIESSCDDTSAAVLRNGVILSNVTASQDVHKAYGGVVPELASRAHQQNIVPVVDQAIKRAGITKEQLSAVAFTRGPGLMGSLLVGVSFAKGFARALGIPLIDVNHLQGHVLAHFIKENDDDNKVFSISFRTTPADGTGVAHIVEHSVLCGSRKYPLKEPFVELVKGSLNTFLNAMTFPDKTMYPVASRNDKDFQNLMDVYLDAVFYPSMKEMPEIFQQEGWHYEIDNAEEPL